jgi:hypothetical protein
MPGSRREAVLLTKWKKDTEARSWGRCVDRGIDAFPVAIRVIIMTVAVIPSVLFVPAVVMPSVISGKGRRYTYTADYCG